jgi:hypothetical protein
VTERSRDDLVEAEGVNAGSGDPEPTGPAGDVLAGGRPESADEQARPAPAQTVLGPPDEDDESYGSEPIGAELR